MASPFIVKTTYGEASLRGVVQLDDIGVADHYSQNVSRGTRAARKGDTEVETAALDCAAVLRNDARETARRVLRQEYRDALRAKNWALASALSRAIINKGLK